MRILTICILMGLPVLAGILLWHHLKLGPGKLPLIVLGGLVVGAVLVAGYFLLDMGWVARKQGHF
jgi:hypothetical protein